VDPCKCRGPSALDSDIHRAHEHTGACILPCAAASRSHAHATTPCPPVREQIKGAKPGHHARFPRRARPSSPLFARTSAASRRGELRRASTQGHRRISILAELVISPWFPPPLLHPSDIPCSGLVHRTAHRQHRAAGHPYRCRPSSGPPQHHRSPRIEP
jgi:hypothetical protein